MWYLHILLLLLHPFFSVQRAVHTTPSKLRTLNLNGKTLGAGEMCGIYTSRCGANLMCVPPIDDPKPLRALLKGRGQCGYANNITTETSHTTETAPTEAVQAPCRELLRELLSVLGTLLIKPQQEIYLPNCGQDGFFKKKQCWSSRRGQRGSCWCVDENGTLLTSNSTQKSSNC